MTKTDADIATRPLGPTKTLEAEKKKPESKKKCKPNRLISFPGAVRRAQKTIETNTSPSMNPENDVKTGSSPGPSPPQISTSAGCEPESVISAPDPPLPPPSTSAGCEPEPVTSVADPSVPPQPSTSAGYEEIRHPVARFLTRPHVNPLKLPLSNVTLLPMSSDHVILWSPPS